jgi:hypothetical protein
LEDVIMGGWCAIISIRSPEYPGLDESAEQPAGAFSTGAATATHFSFESSHTTQQHCLTAGVCWKMLSQGAGVLSITIRSPEYPGLDDVREEEYATWHDPGWPD